MKAKAGKLTQEQFNRLSSPFVLDMTALFNVIEDEVLKTIQKAKRENWTPEQLLVEIKNILP